MPVLHSWHMLLYIQYVQSASLGYCVLNSNFCTQDGRQCVAQGSAEEPNSKSLPLLSSTTSQGRTLSGASVPAAPAQTCGGVSAAPSSY